MAGAQEGQTDTRTAEFGSLRALHDDHFTFWMQKEFLCSEVNASSQLPSPTYVCIFLRIDHSENPLNLSAMFCWQRGNAGNAMLQPDMPVTHLNRQNMNNPKADRRCVHLLPSRVLLLCCSRVDGAQNFDSGEAFMCKREELHKQEDGAQILYKKDHRICWREKAQTTANCGKVFAVL